LSRKNPIIINVVKTVVLFNVFVDSDSFRILWGI